MKNPMIIFVLALLVLAAVPFKAVGETEAKTDSLKFGNPDSLEFSNFAGEKNKKTGKEIIKRKIVLPSEELTGRVIVRSKNNSQQILYEKIVVDIEKSNAGDLLETFGGRLVLVVRNLRDEKHKIYIYVMGSDSADSDEAENIAAIVKRVIKKDFNDSEYLKASARFANQYVSKTDLK